MKCLLPLFFALWGCVTTPGVTPKILPSGVYHHDVSLAMEGRDLQRFAGILKIDGERLTMIMLSPFGTTMARITDSLHDEDEQLIVYSDDIKAYEGRIATIYRAIKPAFIDAHADEIRMFGRTLLVTHQGTAEPGVPRITVIEGEGMRMAVEVTKYEAIRR